MSTKMTGLIRHAKAMSISPRLSHCFKFSGINNAQFYPAVSTNLPLNQF